MSEEENNVETLMQNLTVEIQGLGFEKITLTGLPTIKAFVEGEYSFWHKMKNRPEFANIHHDHFAIPSEIICVSLSLKFPNWTTVSSSRNLKRY